MGFLDDLAKCEEALAKQVEHLRGKNQDGSNTNKITHLSLALEAITLYKETGDLGGLLVNAVNEQAEAAKLSTWWKASGGKTTGAVDALVHIVEKEMKQPTLNKANLQTNVQTSDATQKQDATIRLSRR